MSETIKLREWSEDAGEWVTVTREMPDPYGGKAVKATGVTANGTLIVITTGDQSDVGGFTATPREMTIDGKLTQSERQKGQALITNTAVEYFDKLKIQRQEMRAKVAKSHVPSKATDPNQGKVVKSRRTSGIKPRDNAPVTPAVTGRMRKVVKGKVSEWHPEIGPEGMWVAVDLTVTRTDPRDIPLGIPDGIINAAPVSRSITTMPTREGSRVIADTVKPTQIPTVNLNDANLTGEGFRERSENYSGPGRMRANRATESILSHNDIPNWVGGKKGINRSEPSDREMRTARDGISVIGYPVANGTPKGVKLNWND